MEWTEVIEYIQKNYDTEVNEEEGYYICPNCGEIIYMIDWGSNFDYCICPVCEIPIEN